MTQDAFVIQFLPELTKYIIGIRNYVQSTQTHNSTSEDAYLGMEVDDDCKDENGTTFGEYRCYWDKEAETIALNSGDSQYDTDHHDGYCVAEAIEWCATDEDCRTNATSTLIDLYAQIDHLFAIEKITEFIKWLTANQDELAYQFTVSPVSIANAIDMVGSLLPSED